MTDQELKDIVAAVVAELEKSGVDFDYKADQAKDDDLVFVIRGTAPNYQGVTVTWKGLLDIITAQATQAKNDAETAKNAANTILEQVQSKGTEITNFVATSKAELETQKNESVNAVKSVYQTDLNELKGDLGVLLNDIGNPKTLSGSSTAVYVWIECFGALSVGDKIVIDGYNISTNPPNISIYKNENGTRTELFNTSNTNEYTLTENVSRVDIVYNSGGVPSTYEIDVRLVTKDRCLYENVNLLNKRVSVIEEENSKFTVDIDESEFANAFWMSNGAKALTSNWTCTGLIDIEGYDGSTIEFNTSVYVSASTIFADKSGNVLKYINETNISDYGKTAGTNLQRFTDIIPNGCAYICLNKCWPTASASDFDVVIHHKKEYDGKIKAIETNISNMSKDVDELKTYTDTRYADKKILVIGDSISTDSYGNYKKWVTNLIDDGFFKSENVTNSSYHATGFVADYVEGSYHSGTFIERVTAIENKDTYDVVVVFGGINDYIDPKNDISWESFTNAVDTFFEYLIQNFTQARICVLRPLRTFNIYPNNNTGKYQTDYSEYINSVAKNYCLPVLNLTEESGFCPFVATFKEKWTLVPQGYTSGDGVHPNAEYEKNFLAPMIKNFLLGL